MVKKYDIGFIKAVASGNDFVMLDDLDGRLGARKLDYPALAREICPRRTSVGADGLIVLEPSKKADIRMRIINPDGSEAAMCGNGARASALYAARKLKKDRLTIETGAGLLDAGIKGDTVKLRMSDPREMKLNLDIKIGDTVLKGHYVNTGVPHVVVIVEDIEKFLVNEVGRRIRHHVLFTPAGTNADFVGDIKDNGASIRTYERGVEDETLACGTGSTASAVILGMLRRVSSPVKMKTRGGEVLTIYFKIDKDKVTDVYLEGACSIVFEGKI